MFVTFESTPSCPLATAAVPRHYLSGPKDRRYVFIDLGDAVRVRKYQDQRLIEDREMIRGSARSLWAWLLKIGYCPQ